MPPLGFPSDPRAAGHNNSIPSGFARHPLRRSRIGRSQATLGLECSGLSSIHFWKQILSPA